MDDSLLLKTSLILALAGLSIITILASKLDLKQSNIASLNEEMLNKNIKIKGLATPITSNSLIQLIELQDNTGKIKIVLYKSNLKIEKGSILEVEGRVTKYNQELQFTADFVKVLT